MKCVMHRDLHVLNQIFHSWMILDYHDFFQRTLVALHKKDFMLSKKEFFGFRVFHCIMAQDFSINHTLRFVHSSFIQPEANLTAVKFFSEACIFPHWCWSSFIGLVIVLFSQNIYAIVILNTFSLYEYT